MSEEGPSLCEVGGSGTLILPLFGDAEQRWPAGLRVVLYLLGLGWCFLGVAIISDIFMGAIEKITSGKVRKYNSITQKYYTATVWNPTVANLTLMALGSSAPEILLSVIETCITNKMYAGDLGPGTIVGSAAYNLFMIIAVCIVSIPDGEIRKIKEIPVYIVTASCSIFAYLWLLIVLQFSSPHVVEPWEGILTFLFFPILTLVAYLADRGYLSPGGTSAAHKSERLIASHMSNDELAEVRAKIVREHNGKISDEMVAKIIGFQYSHCNSRAHYRVHATRRIIGGKRVRVAYQQARTFASQPTRLVSALRSKKVVPENDQPMIGVVPGGIEATRSLPTVEECSIQFAASTHAVLENVGTKSLKVVRQGALDYIITVRYRTRDGSAKAQGRQASEDGEGDYIHAEGSLTFEAGEQEKFVDIKILDDYTYEDDEDFFVDLYDPKVIQELEDKDRNSKVSRDVEVQVDLGRLASARIVIIDDDMPGILSFEQEEYSFKDQPHDFVEELKVVRKSGSKSTIRCQYVVEGDSAIPGRDFEAVDGFIELEDGVTEALIPVKVLARGRYNTQLTFRVTISSITPASGATFDPTTDGGAESCIATVHIMPDKLQVERVDKIVSTLRHNWDKAKIGNDSWKEQFKAALYVNGGDGDDDEGDEEPPSILDWVMHIVTLPWKLLFAFCPPTDYCGGWLCFLCSLMMIGLVTTIIGDMANLFGCVIPSMENEITAITLVALGTSLPDTFASKAAAEQDPHADASVGNVTGSNSVNVFLGLGLPWTIASLYWWCRGDDPEWDLRYQFDSDLSFLGAPGKRSKAFVLKAESLSFNVIVFIACAACALFILAMRRRLFGGELGGPRIAKKVSAVAFTFLWLVYVVLSVMKIKGAL